MSLVKCDSGLSVFWKMLEINVTRRTELCFLKRWSVVRIFMNFFSDVEQYGSIFKLFDFFHSRLPNDKLYHDLLNNVADVHAFGN